MLVEVLSVAEHADGCLVGVARVLGVEGEVVEHAQERRLDESGADGDEAEGEAEVLSAEGVHEGEHGVLGHGVVAKVGAAEEPGDAGDGDHSALGREDLHELVGDAQDSENVDVPDVIYFG